MNIFLASAITIAMASTGQVVAADADIANAVPTDDSSHASPAPGFDCARARSRVEHLICTTPELAELDAQLGDIFLNASGQAGLNKGAAA